MGRDRKSRTISINQQVYIDSIVEKFKLTSVKQVATPMEANALFLTQQSPSSLNQVEHMKGVPYSKAIGLILWATVVSQLDTAYMVGVLSQSIQNPGPAHWEGVRRVISYLGSMKELWLTFGRKKEVLLEGYSDSDWASHMCRHSISSYSFNYGCGVVSVDFEKAKHNCAIQHQGRIHCPNTCGERGHLAEVIHQQSQRWTRRTTHHHGQQPGCDSASKRQQVPLKDQAYRSAISFYP